MHTSNRIITRVCLLILALLGWIYSPAQSTDLQLLRNINRGEYPGWDKGMKGLSFSVYGAMPLSVAGIWYYGHQKKDPVMMRNAYKSAVSIGFALLTSTTIKMVVKRKRPFVDHPEIIQRDKVGPLSFPSGHTTSAFATATALSLSTKSWKVALPAYLYASAVGYSRMRLGVHYPSDVLGGMVIGIGAGLLTWKLDQVINGK